MQKSFRSSLLPLVVAFGYLIALSGCATLLVAGAVVTTVDVIHDRRTVGEYIDDSSIELTARNYLISSKEIRMGANVKAVSWNGILLLSGENRIRRSKGKNRATSGKHPRCPTSR